MSDQAAQDKGEAKVEGEAAQQVEAGGAAAAAAAAGARAEAEGAQPAAQPGLVEIKERLYAILRTVNFEVRGAEGCVKVCECVGVCVGCRVARTCGALVGGAPRQTAWPSDSHECVSHFFA